MSRVIYQRCPDSSHIVPLEGLEPPTLSLGRNCSSIELQRLTQKVYRGRGRDDQCGWRAAMVAAISVMRASGIPSV
jgi:hypothetical protein